MWEQLLESAAASGPVALVLMGMLYLVWQQNKALFKELKSDKLKMLKLAMRVTRAVETLAGLEEPNNQDIEDEEDK